MASTMLPTLTTVTPPEVVVTPIDFSQTRLAKSYTGFYAKILDGVFTQEECDALFARATAPSRPASPSDVEVVVDPPQPKEWLPAGLSTQNGQTVHKDFRNSDRILRIDEEASKWIYERLKPYVEELYDVDVKSKWAGIVGKVGRKQGPTWKLVRVNPRLSFLRYGPGHYFKQHCDGLVSLDSQKSFVTLHIYLNEGGAGGATRFWTADKKEYLDVFPKLGRVLIFQQRMLIHSGEEVTSGLKLTLRSEFMFEEVEE